jgi:hypothetical protein
MHRPMPPPATSTMALIAQCSGTAAFASLSRFLAPVEQGRNQEECSRAQALASVKIKLELCWTRGSAREHLVAFLLRAATFYYRECRASRVLLRIMMG